MQRGMASAGEWRPCHDGGQGQPPQERFVASKVMRPPFAATRICGGCRDLSALLPRPWVRGRQPPHFRPACCCCCCSYPAAGKRAGQGHRILSSSSSSSPSSSSPSSRIPSSSSSPSSSSPSSSSPSSSSPSSPSSSSSPGSSNRRPHLQVLQRLERAAAAVVARERGRQQLRIRARLARGHHHAEGGQELELNAQEGGAPAVAVGGRVGQDVHMHAEGVRLRGEGGQGGAGRG